MITGGSSSGGGSSRGTWLFLKRALTFLGTYKGLMLGCILWTSFQLMFDALSRIGPMVSMSVLLDDALVLATVLQRVIKAVSTTR